jgi:uncharacterized membrane protein
MAKKLIVENQAELEKLSWTLLVIFSLGLQSFLLYSGTTISSASGSTSVFGFWITHSNYPLSCGFLFIYYL